ncbi:MAG: adenosylhomocysteinase [Bacillota bacterium]|nr:adenosylhomocysteinase [Bacillota bacterium]
MKSLIKDANLSPEGQLKLDWAKNHMPVLNLFVEQNKDSLPFKDMRINICLHIEAKTGCLALALKEMGATVSLAACNPLSTQDDVAAALDKNGVAVFGIHGADDALYERCISESLANKPQLIIDDGGDLAYLLHTEKQELIPDIIGGCEETTTGLNRLRAMADKGELSFPMVAVNDADCKHLFDNRYGTGQSAWAAIMTTTNLIVAGQTVVVAGYGWCGRGLAMRAKALGARVIVTEIDEVKALEALMDGYDVMPMAEAAKYGDFFITVTGNRDVLSAKDFAVMKDGAVLSNAGHFDVEINKEELKEITKEVKIVRENIEEYGLKDGRKLYLLGEGRLVNLACGLGHPVEIMDMSFAVQAASLLYLKEAGKALNPMVHPVPASVDKKVATLKLASLGKTIDKLTPVQEKYWNNK